MASALKKLGIEHVVVLMLENRGFDHFMGWLYEKDERVNLISQPNDRTPFTGLTTLSKEDFQALANKDPLPNSKAQPPIRGARSPITPAYNPGEHFVHIMAQMWGISKNEVDWGDPKARNEAIAKITGNSNLLGPAPMNGYMIDFAETVQDEAKVTPTTPIIREIMETYIPQQLPVLSGLARHYAVSDQWYCSVPSQTNTNRAFSMAGTSRGLVTNNFYDAFVGKWANPGVKLAFGSHGSHMDQLPGYPRNLFTLLSDFGVPWKVFWQDPWPPKDLSLGFEYQYIRKMFKELNESQFNKHFVKFDASDPNNPLFKQAREGNLPELTWIEPKWGGGSQWDTIKRAVGNDFHPVSDTTVGEDFVNNLYKALTTRADGRPNPCWPKTLFVITFDENGGTYDHVSPPPASPTWRDKAPADHTHPDMDPETRTQFGFEFNQFGIRVPTMLISPLIRPNTLFRSTSPTPYDHASLIATILDWQEINRKSWLLGDRVASAPTFDNVLQLDQATARNPLDTKVGLSLSPSIPVKRPETTPLQYGAYYILELVGSRWGTTSAPVYMGKPVKSVTHYYPINVSAREEAAPMKFESFDQDTDGKPIMNMSTLKLRHGSSDGKGGLIGAYYSSQFMYFSNQNDKPFSGQNWQIRIFSDRDENQEVRTEEDIFLVSLLEPNTAQNLSQRATPDPLKRLTSYKEGFTTKAGEWAIWRVLKA